MGGKEELELLHNEYGGIGRQNLIIAMAEVRERESVQEFGSYFFWMIQMSYYK